jgi:SCP-2 sterol transfer family
VARLYSPEWIEAFNACLADLDTGPATAGADSLVAAQGRFSVAQSMTDTPEGELTVTLTVEEGHCTMQRGLTGRPDVTVSLSYHDAGSLSRGELDAAKALGSGAIRVRGDLSVLVAAQGLLGAASDRLGELRASTTY